MRVSESYSRVTEETDVTVKPEDGEVWRWDGILVTELWLHREVVTPGTTEELARLRFGDGWVRISHHRNENHPQWVRNAVAVALETAGALTAGGDVTEGCEVIVQVPPADGAGGAAHGWQCAVYEADGDPRKPIAGVLRLTIDAEELITAEMTRSFVANATEARLTTRHIVRAFTFGL